MKAKIFIITIVYFLYLRNIYLWKRINLKETQILLPFERINPSRESTKNVRYCLASLASEEPIYTRDSSWRAQTSSTSSSSSLYEMWAFFFWLPCSASEALSSLSTAFTFNKRFRFLSSSPLDSSSLSL